MNCIRIYWILFLISAWANAQDWRPFPEGKNSVFKYTTSYSAWQYNFIQSKNKSGSDSIFIFNQQTMPCGQDEVCNSIWNYSEIRIPRQPGILGTACIMKPNGSYGLVSSFGDTLWFFTHLPVGSYWNARPYLPGYDTARITAYGYGAIPGFPADSFVVIQYYGNRTLEISKTFGVRYFDGFIDKLSLPFQSLVLPASRYLKYKLVAPLQLIGQRIGTQHIGKRTAYPGDAYSFSTGDVLVMKSYYDNTTYLPQGSLTYYRMVDTVSLTDTINLVRMERQTHYGTLYPGHLNTIQVSLPSGMPETTLGYPIMQSKEYFSILGSNSGGNSGIIADQPYNSDIALLNISHIAVSDTDECNGFAFYVLSGFEMSSSSVLLSEGGISYSRLSYGWPFEEWVSSLNCLKKPGHPLSNILCGEQVGVSQDLFELPFELYPNPSTEEITIRSTTNNPFTLPIRIIDLQGCEILQIPTPELNEISIDLSSIPAGVYILQTQIGMHLINAKIVRNEF